MVGCEAYTPAFSGFFDDILESAQLKMSQTIQEGDKGVR